MASGGAQVQAEPPLFPPEVVNASGNEEWGFTTRLRQSPLWPASARAGYTQRYRIFIGGGSIHSWSVSIDERPGGRLIGHWAENNGRGAVTDRMFGVRAADMADLASLAGEAQLWTIYPQFYTDIDEGLCLWHITVILERVDSAGYRFARGHSTCALGQQQIAFLDKMLEMAGRRDMQRWVH